MEQLQRVGPLSGVIKMVIRWGMSGLGNYSFTWGEVLQCRLVLKKQ